MINTQEIKDLDDRAYKAIVENKKLDNLIELYSLEILEGNKAKIIEALNFKDFSKIDEILDPYWTNFLYIEDKSISLWIEKGLRGIERETKTFLSQDDENEFVCYFNGGIRDRMIYYFQKEITRAKAI